VFGLFVLPVRDTRDLNKMIPKQWLRQKVILFFGVSSSLWA